MRNTVIDPKHAQTFNNLARLRAQEMLLRDLAIDLTICKIEGYCPKSYITDLKKLIDNIYEKVKNDTE